MTLIPTLALEIKSVMEWYSSLLIFHFSTQGGETRTLESLCVFRSTDFGAAFSKAKEIGVKHAEERSLRFVGVENLDLVGSAIDGEEVWSRISEGEVPFRAGLDHPSQTI
jgi:hypothetical protein